MLSTFRVADSAIVDSPVVNVVVVVQIFRNEVLDTVPQNLTVQWFVKVPRRGIIRYSLLPRFVTSHRCSSSLPGGTNLLMCVLCVFFQRATSGLLLPGTDWRLLARILVVRK